MDELLCCVWLAENLGAGSEFVGSLLDEYGGAAAVYDNARVIAQKYPRIAEATKNFSVCTLERAERILKICRENSINAVGYTQDGFPKRLRDIPNPPAVIYHKGGADLLSLAGERPFLAIVGTRYISKHGMRKVYGLARSLAEAGFVIVSGMAAGADYWAHRGALDAQGATLAVPGCGLLQTYPPQNAAIKQEILQSGTAVSEYPPRAEAQPHNFPVRNRIISALSDGVLITEVRKGSGALITARHAMEQGRELFAAMTDYDRNGAAQIGELLGTGAVAVSDGTELYRAFKDRYPMLQKPDLAAAHGSYDELYAVEREAEQPLPWMSRTVPKAAQTGKYKLPDTVTPTAKRIFEELDAVDAVHVDELAARLQLTGGQVLAALTELEIADAAIALPGRHYIRRA